VIFSIALLLIFDNAKFMNYFAYKNQLNLNPTDVILIPMKSFITLLFLLLAAINSACSNSVDIITIRISSLHDSKIFLASMRGDAYKIIDTAELKNNVCTFSMSAQNNLGVYKIIPEASLMQSRRNTPLNSIDIIITMKTSALKLSIPGFGIAWLSWNQRKTRYIMIF